MKMYLPPPGGKSGRRSFLKRGLFGGLLLALGGAGFLVFRRGAQVRLPEGLKVLDQRDYPLIVALAHRFLPRRDGFPAVEALDVAAAVDLILTRVDDSARMELKQLFILFENALPNFLFGGRPRAFTQLSEDEQDQVLTEWANSSIIIRRTGYLAMRTLVMAAYYGNAATWPSVKYPGPPKGIHDPNAPVWKGDGPRPLGNGTWVAPEPVPTPAPAKTDAATDSTDGGTK